MVSVIKISDFKGVARNVKPDAKKRVMLPKALVREDVTYHIYSNSLGQIILDPQVSVPASEVWLFKTPKQRLPCGAALRMPPKVKFPKLISIRFEV